MLPLCEKLDIAFIPFYPLASGLLTGKYQRGVAAPAGARLAKREQIATDEQWDIIEKLSAFAEEHGRAALGDSRSARCWPSRPSRV